MASEVKEANDTEFLNSMSDIVQEEDDAEPDTDHAGPEDGYSPVWHGRNHRRRYIAIASVIAVVVILAGAGGYAYATSNMQKGADAAYAKAYGKDCRGAGTP